MLKYLLAVVAGFTLYGQHSTFNWFDELCEYESAFDSTLYSKSQIENSFYLAVSNMYDFEKLPLVYYPKEIEKLSLDEIEKEYEFKSSKLRSLNLPQSEIWEAIRREKLNEVEQLHIVAVILFKAFTEPGSLSLKQFSSTDTCLSKYSIALRASPN